MNLTSTIVRQKSVKQGQILWVADSACPGLRLRLSRSQKDVRIAAFYYRYVDRSGRKRPVKLGDHPAMTIEQARTLVNIELRPLAKSGIDVAAQYKRSQTVTVVLAIRELIPDYLAYCERRGKAPATVESYRRYLRPIAHWWGDRLPVDISRGDVQDIFDRVKADGVPPFDIDGTELRNGKSTGGHRSAGLTLSASRAFWTWLINREHAAVNPWRDQKDLAEESQSGIAERALTDEEIRAVLAVSDSVPLRMMLATGLRPNEVCGARWTEIDLDTGVWIIPGERMKYKKKSHCVFLSNYAMAVLRQHRRRQVGRPRYVFPASGAAHPHIMATNLVRHFASLGVDGFSPKVCRATVRTGLQQLGCPSEVRSRISHHQIGDRVSRAYDKYTFDDESKHWWQVWGMLLTMLEEIL
jgi:integrase